MKIYTNSLPFLFTLIFFQFFLCGNVSSMTIEEVANTIQKSNDQKKIDEAVDYYIKNYNKLWSEYRALENDARLKIAKNPTIGLYQQHRIFKIKNWPPDPFRNQNTSSVSLEKIALHSDLDAKTAESLMYHENANTKIADIVIDWISANPSINRFRLSLIISAMVENQKIILSNIQLEKLANLAILNRKCVAIYQKNTLFVAVDQFLKKCPSCICDGFDGIELENFIDLAETTKDQDVISILANKGCLELANNENISDHTLSILISKIQLHYKNNINEFYEYDLKENIIKRFGNESWNAFINKIKDGYNPSTKTIEFLAYYEDSSPIVLEYYAQRYLSGLVPYDATHYMEYLALNKKTPKETLVKLSTDENDYVRLNAQKTLKTLYDPQ